MRNTDSFKNKPVAILGLARSGLACANLLFRLGARVWVTDNLDNETTRQNASKLVSKEINVELGSHSEEFIQGKELLIISPGVCQNAMPLVWARALKIPVISEIECAWILCPAQVIAVTGSNGKTTVTTLIGKILEASKKNVFVCGNIGNPFCAEVEKLKAGDFVSLEISSFQLEAIDRFKPHIAVMLNFNRNHLDRHKDMQEYLLAKKRIFMNQDAGDYLLLNAQDPAFNKLALEAKSQVVFFKEEAGLNPNQAAVVAVGKILGIDEGVTRKVLEDFPGIEHRMEKVATINGVEFVNDSKATTAEATLWALKNIQANVILIAGGRDKGADYGAILEVARIKVKKAILIGEAKEKIRASLKGMIASEDAATLGEALDRALQVASPGDCVILSPMCSSFDMFRDYEERGRLFKQAVNDLAKLYDLRAKG